MRKISYKRILLILLAISLLFLANSCKSGSANKKSSSSASSSSNSSKSQSQSASSSAVSSASDSSSGSSSLASSGINILGYIGGDANDASSGDTQYDAATLGVGYDAAKDPFYKKSTIYATWLNVWMGSDASWWKSSPPPSGITALVNGKYVPLNSNDGTFRQYMFNEAKDAGINAIIMDLTNGYSGWYAQSKDYQKLCYENGMKFAAAVAVTPGASNIEDICNTIMNNYAKLGATPYSSSYLYKNGKPVLVLYCERSDFDAASASTGPNRSKFELVWASGEDSNINKWGWQIEPFVGPMPSNDSMFVTGSIAYHESQDTWRKSLAMLDFCFLAEKVSSPKYAIIGSMDDISERNGWLVADTTNAIYRGLQSRDITGSLSTDVYYNRVKSWINGTAQVFNAGGIINDGAYTIVNSSSGVGFGAVRPVQGTSNDLAATLQRGLNLSTDMETYYWIYYLGNNNYRIIKLSSGLSLQADNNNCLIQYWDDNVDSQVWQLKKQTNGSFLIVNKANGKALYDANYTSKTITTVAENATDTKQQWMVTPVPGRTMG